MHRLMPRYHNNQTVAFMPVRKLKRTVDRGITCGA